MAPLVAVAALHDTLIRTVGLAMAFLAAVVALLRDATRTILAEVAHCYASQCLVR